MLHSKKKKNNYMAYKLSALSIGENSWGFLGFKGRGKQAYYGNEEHSSTQRQQKEPI